MNNTVRVVILVALGGLSGFAAGRWSSHRDANALTLARDLETISLCANGLNTLDTSPVRTTRLLDHRLRTAVAAAAERSASSADFSLPAPNLVDGLRRARMYAERKGDKKFAAEIAQLQMTINFKL
jgi:hypothetical protein